MSDDVVFTGGDALFRALQELPLKLEKNVMRGAIRAGSKPIADDAKSRAPILRDPDPRRRPGALRDAIRVRSVNIKNGVVMGGVMVGALTGRQIAAFKRKTGKGGGANPNDPFYAKFVEFGTVKMAAQPFMRPALAAKSSDAIDAVAIYVRDRLDKEAGGK